MSFTRLHRLTSPGTIFRELVAAARPAGSTRSSPLPILGTPHAFSALLAAHAGVKAIYLSGSSLSTVALGLPDLGVITSADVAEETRRITACCPLPLLVDIDTGLADTALGIRRTIQQVERAGACGVHLEDQSIDQKRCGHRPNKSIVSIAEMTDRIRAAVSARDDPAFVIMARTDSLASESAADALKRIAAYTEAGADMIFLEAARQLSNYSHALSAMQHRTPLLANMTESASRRHSRCLSSAALECPWLCFLCRLSA
jgi:methylisocitrate lyase